MLLSLQLPPQTSNYMCSYLLFGKQQVFLQFMVGGVYGDKHVCAAVGNCPETQKSVKNSCPVLPVQTLLAS